MLPSIASPLTLLLAASYALPSFGLYFYIDGITPKCFFEELPKDTLVVGKCQIPLESSGFAEQRSVFAGRVDRGPLGRSGKRVYRLLTKP